ncbi:hypothetical protein H2200_005915 [Cladophialophora chaetospira]|uniref:DUF7918 domain-containing protein n=1 Tax=Cladophialophora chaetospira TaxID=386627 RepID=A0AA38XAK5_9EURO|nr:hypothetical protein H2200_005915 [Cladophialophora chaetospira]
MAVIDQIKVTVRAGNQTLQEYDLPQDEQDNQPVRANTTVKYLEAIANTDYELKCGISAGGFDLGEADYLSFKFYVDGKYTSSYHFRKARYRASAGSAIISQVSRAIVDGQWRGIPYRWGELITTEEQSHLTLEEMKQRYAELGTMRLEVWRKEGTETRAARPRYLSPARETIPEKALKGKAMDLASQ